MTTTTNALATLDNNAPAPLEPLRHVIIHPANIAAEARQRRAVQLRLGQVLRLKIQRFFTRNPNQQAELTRVLEDHHLAVERNRLEQELFKSLAQEARIYAQIIIKNWDRLGLCHRRYVKERLITESVRFSRVDITADSIHFKIDASFKSLFGWKAALPQDVHVGDLLSERTLFELSIACQRQVTGVSNINGAWIVVNRLNSMDGLMNYVTYNQVMEHYVSWVHERVPVCVGVGTNRQIKWVNMADFPHWLVAGWTGSGKSNITNVIISTIISKQPPANVRIVLIDLKGGLEFSFYEGIPHLIGNIVTEIAGVASKLAQLEGLMSTRFEKFRAVKAKRLEDYNAKVEQEKHEPRVVIFFDEFAAIQNHGERSRRIIASVMQLAARGRAVGIHIVICTQHSSVDIIPGNIKTNLSVRLSGRMPTTSASITVLGTGDAKDLAPVEGRMMMMIGPDPEPIQTPHITDEHIGAVLQQAKAWGDAPELELPEAVTHQHWTPEKIAEFAVKHLEGSLSGKRIYDSIKDDGTVSSRQVYDFIEQIWEQERIKIEGNTYKVIKNTGNRGKRLVPIEEKELTSGAQQ